MDLKCTRLSSATLVPANKSLPPSPPWRVPSQTSDRHPWGGGAGTCRIPSFRPNELGESESSFEAPRRPGLPVPNELRAPVPRGWLLGARGGQLLRSHLAALLLTSAPLAGWGHLSWAPSVWAEFSSMGSRQELRLNEKLALCVSGFLMRDSLPL